MEPTEQQSSPAGPDRFLSSSILVAAIMISAALIYTTRAKTGTPPVVENSGTDTSTAEMAASVLEPLPRDVVLGEADAPITLTEYGDYQCPWCALFFSSTEAQIREGYVKTGKVKMVYRDFAFLGSESIDAANAAECAKDQGKFWAYHDALFTTEHADNEEGNGNLNRALFLKLAGDAGMDVGKFTTCLDGNTYADNVQATYQKGSSVGVGGTPTIFVNGKEFKGDYPAFQALFDSYLKK